MPIEGGEEMKTLIVYIKDSYYKFHELYKKHVYEITDVGLLKVYTLDPHTGEEVLEACFNQWTYFLIDEE